MKAVIAYGSTPAGSTNWMAYGEGSLVLDVDTSEAGFTSTPKYFTSLGGRTHHWKVVGATSIYSATPRGFRIYITALSGAASSDFTIKKANGFGWHVNWFGIGATV